jgi:hypothetical protein
MRPREMARGWWTRLRNVFMEDRMKNNLKDEDNWPDWVRKTVSILAAAGIGGMFILLLWATP